MVYKEKLEISIQNNLEQFSIYMEISPMQKCTLKSNKLYNVSNLFSHRDLISHFQWFRWYYHGSTIAMVVYHHELVRIFRLESIEKKIILPTRQNGMRLVIARQYLSHDKGFEILSQKNYLHFFKSYRIDLYDSFAPLYWTADEQCLE